MNSKYEAEEALKNAALSAESKSTSGREEVQQQAVSVERALTEKSVYVHGGERYTREKVNSAYFDGDWGGIPRSVVEYFGYSYNMAE